VNTAHTLAEVLARPDVWRGDCFPEAAALTLSSGYAALDAELPGGGWPRGALTELLVDGPGLGEVSLLLRVRALCGNGGGGWLEPAGGAASPRAGLGRSGVDSAVDGGGAGGGPAMPAMRCGRWNRHWRERRRARVLGLGASADARAVRRLQVAAGGSTLAFLPSAAHRRRAPAPPGPPPAGGWACNSSNAVGRRWRDRCG
jgi:cell division inhibitor SulA/protein ImuA